MKLYAYIEPSRFKAYLTEHQYVETEESRSLFLRDVGTTGIVFDRVKVGYVEVSPGSCIRLRSADIPKPVVVSSDSPVVAHVSDTIFSYWSRKWASCW